MFLLKYNTTNVIPLGYFLDSTDGDSEEGALTIANTDIKLWKYGATSLVSKNSGGATHMSNGVYYATLDATDCNTIGPMVIFIHVAGALSVRLECHVIPSKLYTAWFSSVYQTVDVVSISGSTTAADNAEIVYDTDFATNYNATADRWDVNVDAIRGDTTAADNLQVVFNTDFATNYDSAANRWTVDVEAIGGNSTVVGNMGIVFNTDFGTNYDTVNDQWDVSVSAGGAAASVTVKDVKDMIPGRPFPTVLVSSDDTVDYLTDSGRNVDSDGNVADVAYIQCASSNDLRYAFGVDPTQGAGGLGHDMSEGDKLTLYGNSQIANFRFTNATNGSNSAFIVTFFRSGRA